MKHTLFAAISLAVSAFVPGIRAAETLVVPYSHPWQYLHPMGMSPALIDLDFDGNPDHPEFDNTWWLAVQDFASDYDGPAFGNPSTGTPGTYHSWDGGMRSGPLGYGDVDNWNGINTPLLVPFESPSSPITAWPGNYTFKNPGLSYRKSAYFRTTFDLTQPLNNPVIRCMVDDGAVIFLDGVQIVRVNIRMSTMPDGIPLYTTTANSDPGAPNQTENTLYTINLNQSGLQGSTGTLQAEVINTVTSLAPGIHTLAVCLVNVNASSPDLLMAMQMTADDGGINPLASNISRNTSGTPLNPADDTFEFDVVVNQTSGAPGSWRSNLSALSTGNYGTTYHFSGFPVSGSAEILFSDALDPSVTALLSVPAPPPPLWIGQINLPGQTGPLVCTSATAPEWSQIGAETALLTNAGASPRDLESIAVAIPAEGAVFSAILEVEENSVAGNFESSDSVAALLILNDGTTTDHEVSLLPVSLDRNGDHVLTGYDAGNYNSNIHSDELNPAGLPAESSYVEGIALSAVIPPGTVSARLVVRAANNHSSEFFRIKQARFSPAGTVSDLDRDGISDADELAAGTNPLNASSRFSFTHSRIGNNIDVTFPTVANRVYRVLSSTNMLVWTPENTSAITGNGNFITYSVPAGATRKFFFIQSGRGLNPWP